MSVVLTLTGLLILWTVRAYLVTLFSFRVPWFLGRLSNRKLLLYLPWRLNIMLWPMLSRKRSGSVHFSVCWNSLSLDLSLFSVITKPHVLFLTPPQYLPVLNILTFVTILFVITFKLVLFQLCGYLQLICRLIFLPKPSPLSPSYDIATFLVSLFLLLLLKFLLFLLLFLLFFFFSFVLSCWGCVGVSHSLRTSLYVITCLFTCI